MYMVTSPSFLSPRSSLVACQGGEVVAGAPCRGRPTDHIKTGISLEGEGTPFSRNGDEL